MSYSVVAHAAFKEQAAGLPAEGQKALVELLRRLSNEPGLLEADRLNPHKRTATFICEVGEGMVDATVSDESEVIILNGLVWASIAAGS